jgi:hypothetical protein
MPVTSCIAHGLPPYIPLLGMMIAAIFAFLVNTLSWYTNQRHLQGMWFGLSWDKTLQLSHTQCFTC